MAEVTVREFMLEHPAAIKGSTPLVTAVEMLINKNIAGLAVVNEENEVTGFISDYDCHKAMLMSSYHCDNPVYVSDIQHQDYIAINPDDGIADIAIKLLNEPSSLYLVIENKKLTGTLTRLDILNTLNKNLSLCSKISVNA
jgi:predicted transcriptional regulator